MEKGVTGQSSRLSVVFTLLLIKKTKYFSQLKRYTIFQLIGAILCMGRFLKQRSVTRRGVAGPRKTSPLDFTAQHKSCPHLHKENHFWLSLQLWFSNGAEKPSNRHDPRGFFTRASRKNPLAFVTQLQCDKQRHNTFCQLFDHLLSERKFFFFLKVRGLRAIGGFFRYAFLSWERQDLKRASKDRKRGEKAAR